MLRTIAPVRVSGTHHPQLFLDNIQVAHLPTDFRTRPPSPTTMSGYKSLRRVNGGGDGEGGGEDSRMRLKQSGSNVSDDQELFMGVNFRRKASLYREVKGDYLDVPSHPHLMKILYKQGDNQVLFADKVLKFTSSGKMKRRILLVTDYAIYIIDPETEALKRRIALAAVEKLLLSELSNNFFAIVVPNEYDVLMASARKTEIVTVLIEAIKNASGHDLDVVFSNRFEYRAAAEFVKEVQFETVEGGVKTRILRAETKV